MEMTEAQYMQRSVDNRMLGWEQLQRMSAAEAVAMLEADLGPGRPAGYEVWALGWKASPTTRGNLWTRVVDAGTYTLNGDRAPLIFVPKAGEPYARGQAPDPVRRLSTWLLDEMNTLAFPGGLWSADGRKVLRSKFRENYLVVIDHLNDTAHPAGTLCWTHPMQGVNSVRPSWHNDVDVVTMDELVFTQSLRKVKPAVRRKLQELHDYVRVQAMAFDCDLRSAPHTGKDFRRYVERDLTPRELVDEQAAAITGLSAASPRGMERLSPEKAYAYAVWSALEGLTNCQRFAYDARGPLSVHEVTDVTVEHVVKLLYGSFAKHEKLYLFNPKAKHIGKKVEHARINELT